MEMGIKNAWGAERFSALGAEFCTLLETITFFLLTNHLVGGYHQRNGRFFVKFMKFAGIMEMVVFFLMVKIF